jgi:hypothetical protein
LDDLESQLGSLEERSKGFPSGSDNLLYSFPVLVAGFLQDSVSRSAMLLYRIYEFALVLFLLTFVA